MPRFVGLLGFVGSVAALSGVETLYPPGLASTAYISNTSIGTYGGTYKAGTNGPTSPSTYGSYDYCSMPHPRKHEYTLPAAVQAAKKGHTPAKLVYLDYMQRHQRRTPYNLLPGGEDQRYECDNVRPYLYAGPASNSGIQPIPMYAQTYQDSSDPFSAGVNGTCQYPQITLGGVEDGYEHGKDLWAVYGDKLGLIPENPNSRVLLRSTESPLTQASAGVVMRGVWPRYDGALPLHQMVSSVDTTNSGYSCSARSSSLSALESTDAWKAHLTATAELRASLGSMLGATDSSWQNTFDHFSDNFQGRWCNGYRLPCSTTNSSACVSDEQAEMVFRAGDWEWNYWYAASGSANSTATAALAAKHITLVEGLFIGEAVTRLEAVLNGTSSVDYAHAFVHDNDIGPILGALGINTLRWPAMASNIAFEVWQMSSSRSSSSTGATYYARVLYSGQPIETIHGTLDWIPLSQLISILKAYVPEDIETLCNSSV